MEEPPGLPDELAVGVDLTLVAEVADHVPVEPRLVLPTRGPEAGTQREVHRAADLLVEEDVAREAVDLVVEAECDLAERPRAVRLQQGGEIVAATRGLRPADLAC